MKKMTVAVFCLTAGMAWADDEVVSGKEAADDVGEPTSVIVERISAIEVIDVTSEKPPALIVEEPDADIDAILDEVDAMDDDEESE